MQLTTHPNEWVQYTFQPQFVVKNKKNQFGIGTPAVLNQPQEISSLELVKNKRRDVTGGIQPKFVYQSAFLDYYELVEDWEVETPISMWLKRLRKITYDHFSM
jgi:hypothetical protein